MNFCQSIKAMFSQTFPTKVVIAVFHQKKLNHNCTIKSDTGTLRNKQFFRRLNSCRPTVLFFFCCLFKSSQVTFCFCWKNRLSISFQLIALRYFLFAFLSQIYIYLFKNDCKLFQCMMFDSDFKYMLRNKFIHTMLSIF